METNKCKMKLKTSFKSINKLNYKNIDQISLKHKGCKYLYLIDGKLTLKVNNHDVVLTREHSLMIYDYQSIEIIDSTKSLSCYYLNFNLLIKENSFNYQLDNLQLIQNSNMINVIENINHENTNRLASYECIIENYLNVLIIEMFRTLDTSLVTNQANLNNKAELVQHAKYYINQNLNSNLKVKEIANYLGISSNYLYKLFIEYADCSIQEYIINEKIKQAIELLTNSNLAIGEIALLLNFSSQNHFSNSFKKFTQATPSDYRKRNKSDNYHEVIL